MTSAEEMQTVRLSLVNILPKDLELGSGRTRLEPKSYHKCTHGAKFSGRYQKFKNTFLRVGTRVKTIV